MPEIKDKKKMYRYARIAMDVLCTLIAIIVATVLHRMNRASVIGFFCNDNSIRLPFIKRSTMSQKTLLASIFGIPFLVTALLELKCNWDRKVKRCLKHWLESFHQVFCPLVFGIMVTSALTDVAKFTTAVPRPYFLEVCQPTWNNLNCSTAEDNTYITNYTCAGVEIYGEYFVQHSRLSFWSTHAALSAFSMVYLVLYLHQRLDKADTGLLKCLAQSVCLMFAYYTGITRINDNKHHVSDVLVGFIVGSIMAFLTVLNVKDRWCRRAQHNRKLMSQVSTITTTTATV